MVFVTSSDGSKGIQAIPYDSLKTDIRKAERDLRKKLEETAAAAPESGGDAGAGTTVEKPGGSLLAPSQAWSNTDGKTITAAVAALGATTVTFVMTDGRQIEYPLEKLSAESRERLGKLTAAP